MDHQQKLQSKVPEWMEYYPNLDEATPEQIKFYHYWKDNLADDNFLDLEGNITYVFVYLYSVIRQFVVDKDLNWFLSSLEKIRKGYGHYEKLNSHLFFYESDACLLSNKYDLAWYYRRQSFLNIEDVINIRSKCKETSIDGEDLFKIFSSNSGLTKFGKERVKNKLLTDVTQNWFLA